MKSNHHFSPFLILKRFLASFVLWGALFSLTFTQAQKQMISPAFLKKGDTIALVSTARKHSTDELQPTLDLLKSWGLEVIVGKSIGLAYNQLAGTDEQRTQDFQTQLDNPKVRAIWCVRGGYGTVRLIDQLDFTAFKKQPKWIVGFSDVTVLHSHLNTMGYKSIHGTMPVSIKKTAAESISSLHKALFGEPLSYSLPPAPKNRFGKAKGELVGGNLSILYSLFGSPSAIDCTDKILFIEDLDEYLYHIDRMMMNLKRNGCLESLKGIIVGGMSDMNDNEIPWGKNAIEIIDEVTQKYQIPVVFHFPAGHVKDNRALILGNTITLDVTAKGTTIVFE